MRNKFLKEDYNKEDYNKDQANYAFIIETEEICMYDECVTVKWFENHPEAEKELKSRGTLIGRGYRYNYDIFGNLVGGELCDFWKWQK